ncbi:MAG: hypothetical protein IJY57_02830 [Clostridia bacterium]|nr:hypothetical protein [Clostridia bacterium]
MSKVLATATREKVSLKLKILIIFLFFISITSLVAIFATMDIEGEKKGGTVVVVKGESGGGIFSCDGFDMDYVYAGLSAFLAGIAIVLVHSIKRCKYDCVVAYEDRVSYVAQKDSDTVKYGELKNISINSHGGIKLVFESGKVCDTARLEGGSRVVSVVRAQKRKLQEIKNKQRENMLQNNKVELFLGEELSIKCPVCGAGHIYKTSESVAKCYKCNREFNINKKA